MKHFNLTYLFTVAMFAIFCSLGTNAFAGAKKDNTRVSVVVIDPGHGGKDAGAMISGAREKDIVLDIALKLGERIKANHPEVKVVYTRTKDIFIPLHKRAEIANNNEADLFISIHVNAVDARSVQGTETFVLGLHRSDDNLEVAKKENAVILLEDDYHTTYEGFDPNQPESYIMFETMQEEYQAQSVMLASNIQKEFKFHANRIDRSVKMAGFLVLRRTTMPSVLIETGFLSHSGERSFLLSESGKTQLATSIFRAFSFYKSEIEERSQFSMVTENISAAAEEKTVTPPPAPKADENATTQNIKTNTAPPKQVYSSTPDPKNQLYFSVQIMALKRKLKPTPKNFNGEEKIFRIDSPEISRYFSGKFNSLEKAKAEKARISKKYENAFVVAFENNSLISVKKATEGR